MYYLWNAQRCYDTVSVPSKLHWFIILNTIAATPKCTRNKSHFLTVPTDSYARLITNPKFQLIGFWYSSCADPVSLHFMVRNVTYADLTQIWGGILFHLGRLVQQSGYRMYLWMIGFYLCRVTKSTSHWQLSSNRTFEDKNIIDNFLNKWILLQC